MPAVTPLSTAECERLLRGGVFGRVGLTTPRGPEIVPVNYAAIGDEIVVRTAASSLLATYADGAALVFQMDLVDHERWQGWSVVARGLGVCVTEDAESQRVTRPRSWATGDRTTVVRIAWTELTGRRVGMGWDCLAAMPVRQVL
jgi:nitroimidazol reductase NimA-like FMN-containing flavoprotein (pyridoxamine 5'-phosphate oxidase superfamily)